MRPKLFSIFIMEHSNPRPGLARWFRTVFFGMFSIGALPLFAVPAIVGVAAAGLVVIPDPEFPPPPPQPHSNAAENTSALIIVIPSRISDSPDLWRDEEGSSRRNHQSTAARTASIEWMG